MENPRQTPDAQNERKPHSLGKTEAGLGTPGAAEVLSHMGNLKGQRLSLRWPGRPKETDPRGSHPEMKAEDQSPDHVTAKGLRDREAAGATPGPAHPRAGGGRQLQWVTRVRQSGCHAHLCPPPSLSGIHAPVLKTCSMFLFLTSLPPKTPPTFLGS